MRIPGVVRAMALIAALAAGCDNEIPGETRQPRCEPRSIADPGRLNIDSTAEDYAVVDPCRAGIQFYIARNTALRAISVEITFRDFEGAQVAAEAIALEFAPPRAGMFSETVQLEAIEGHMCRGLLAHLSGLSCRDRHGQGIECPEIRLKTSYVFEDLTIDSAGLDVCYD